MTRTCTLGDTFQKQLSGPVSWGTQGQEDKNDPHDQDQCHGGHEGRNDPQDLHTGGHFAKRPSGPVSWGKNDQCHGGHKGKNDPQGQCHPTCIIILMNRHMSYTVTADQL